jgi:hypothetical protein
MLDPWIIEEIRRREEERRRQESGQRPVIELPISDPRPETEGKPTDGKPGESDPPRGVAIIDYTVG